MEIGNVSGETCRFQKTIMYKKLLVTIRSNLLQPIMYKYTKHYNYLQVYLHILRAYTNIFTNIKVIKIPSL